MRLRTIAAALFSTAARSKRVSFDLKPLAMAKARFTSSTVAFGTVPMSCSVYGLKTSITRSRWTDSPPIRIASRRHSLAFMLSLRWSLRRRWRRR